MFPHSLMFGFRLRKAARSLRALDEACSTCRCGLLLGRPQQTADSALTAMQGQLWGAAALFAVSWMAGWADDMFISEIPGSSSYLIGMGIAGGLTTFSNPLQGEHTPHAHLVTVSDCTAEPSHHSLPHWFPCDRRKCHFMYKLNLLEKVMYPKKAH